MKMKDGFVKEMPPIKPSNACTALEQGTSFLSLSFPPYQQHVPENEATLKIQRLIAALYLCTLSAREKEHERTPGCLVLSLH